MDNFNVRHYLDIYTKRKEMQEKGITNPSEEIKKFTNIFVEKLMSLPLNEIIVLNDHSFFDSQGNLILKMPVTTDSNFKTCREFLLSAINDWPTANLKEPKDLLDELKNEIGKPLTFDNLKNYSDGLKINISGNAWKMESVISLLEMFDFDRNGTIDKIVTLDKIIERLTNHFRAEK